jgi:hypothetical protein
LELLKTILKILKTSYVLFVVLVLSLAIYTQVTKQNPIDDFFTNQKFTKVRQLNLPKNKLNTIDQTIETEDGKLKIKEIKFYKQTAITTDNQKKTSLVITYEFTPKKANIKTNLLFDKFVQVTQNGQVSPPAVFFEGGVDQSVIDSVNQSVSVINSEGVGKTVTASGAYQVETGEVSVKFGNKTTLYFTDE